MYQYDCTVLDTVLIGILITMLQTVVYSMVQDCNRLSAEDVSILLPAPKIINLKRRVICLQDFTWERLLAGSFSG